MDYSGINERVARNLRTIREARRLTGVDVAEAMVERGFAWDKAVVSKSETGIRKAIPVVELAALADVFGVDIALLFSDKLTVTVTIGEGNTMAVGGTSARVPGQRR